MRSLILAGLVALAACNGEPASEPAETAAPDAPQAPDDGWSTPGNDQNAADPAPTPPADDEPSEPGVIATIPEALRGRWGINAADCTSTRGDAKGLVEISASELRFYESVATLSEVEERDATRIVGEFSFVGEGQTWQRRMVLDGQDDGATLIRRDYGDDAMPGPLRYRKCEAA